MIRTQKADTPPKPSKPFTSATLAYQEGYRDGQRDLWALWWRLVDWTALISSIFAALGAAAEGRWGWASFAALSVSFFAYSLYVTRPTTSKESDT